MLAGMLYTLSQAKLSIRVAAKKEPGPQSWMLRISSTGTLHKQATLSECLEYKLMGPYSCTVLYNIYNTTRGRIFVKSVL